MLSGETLIAWNRRQTKASGYAAVQYSQGHYEQLTISCEQPFSSVAMQEGYNNKIREG